MKQILILMLAGILAGAFIYYMNKASLNPMDGATVNGETVNVIPSSTPSESKFEPLDLSSSKDSFGIKHAVAAQITNKASKTSARTMGNADASIKMYVFSSLGCSHCSYFHGVVLKNIEEKYIDTGDVFMTYIDFPSSKMSLSGAMLARCVKQESYFSFLDKLFENQKEWAFKQNGEEIITAYASSEGLTKGDVRACLADTGLQKSILDNRNFYMKKYNIDATPTTVIVKEGKAHTVVGSNGKKLEAVLSKLVNE